MIDIDIENMKATALGISGVLVAVAGGIAVVKGKSGQIREAGGILFVVLLAAFIIAVGSHLEEIGNWLWEVIF